MNEYFVDQTAFEAHQTRNRASNWYQVTAEILREYIISIGDKAIS